ncbi:adenylate kinase, partial [Alistipes putredinis]
MLNIVLFGAPGCGKGTQAARLKEKYGIDHVSTGNVIREEIARGTKLGKEMESYITTGRLAPDQVVIDMIADYIAAHKHAKGNIFDGFPRTTHQAEEFDRMLSEQGLKVDVMIYMDVPEEELVKRILLRGKESGRADDASEEVIRDRIKVYHEQTAIVADFYAKQGKFADINGLGTMDEVFDRICQVTDLPVDVHLMIEDPDRWAPEYAKLGAASISFHMGATHAPVRLARQLRDMGCKACFAVRPAEPVEPIFDILDEFDMV